jgi:hypothetical protein
MERSQFFDRSSHGHALRHLAAPARLRESLSIHRPPSLRNASIAGLQVALAVLLVAPLLHCSAWSHMAGFGGLGALAALFGRFEPLAQRRRTVLLAGGLLALPVALLSVLAWAGLPPVALLLTLAAMAGVLASLAHRTQMGPPGQQYGAAPLRKGLESPPPSAQPPPGCCAW